MKVQLEIKSEPPTQEIIHRPGIFKATATNEKIEVTVLNGVARFTAYSNERDRFDEAGFYEVGSKIKMETLIAVVNAYKLDQKIK